jgi:CheY-like chemotaxis protein
LRRSILLADDNADFASVLSSALEAAGYRVACAANGREALVRQREHPADVLITDLVMPERDGFETIDSFLAEFPRTRIIVISGAGKLKTSLHLSAAKLIGADATLEKPFEVESLLKTLRKLETNLSPPRDVVATRHR